MPCIVCVIVRVRVRVRMCHELEMESCYDFKTSWRHYAKCNKRVSMTRNGKNTIFVGFSNPWGRATNAIASKLVLARARLILLVKA